MLSKTVHGVFLNLFGVGTLLIGKSGSGKSDLALSMLARGHQLIADDVVEFMRSDEKTLLGQAPSSLANLLEVRGIGVIDVAAVFGAQAVCCGQKKLSVVVEMSQRRACSERILSLQMHSWGLLGVFVPHVCLPLSVDRPHDLLLELLVRSYQLKLKGGGESPPLPTGPSHPGAEDLYGR